MLGSEAPAFLFAKIFPPPAGFHPPLAHEWVNGNVGLEAGNMAAPFNI